MEIFPPADTAADGGFQWPFYLGVYGKFDKIWNYATGGTVCSKDLTYVGNDLPDVLTGQMAWFVQDHVLQAGTPSQRLDMNPDEFVVDIFIGTNDVGLGSFITDGQNLTVSLPDLVSCQLQHITNLYNLGVRNFIIQSMAPLHLTGLYSNSSAPTIYYPQLHDGVAWNKRMYNIVNSVNALIQARIPTLKNELKGSSIEYFDTYHFFEDMYDNPSKFFNGTLPPNVTGHCHQCPNATDYHFCGIGDCTVDQRDSFMWWDELHPSEQTGRNLAREMVNKILGKSQY